MIEYAAFGFAVLVWWTWPALWAVVVTAVYASHRVSAWRDRQLEAKQERGPEPCLIHMGTDPDGFEHWCWLKDGHAGPHTNQWGVPQGDFDDELEDKEQAEEDAEAAYLATVAAHPDVPWGEMQPPPGLPVPPALCEWGEDGRGNESACWKPHGHDGPHMVQDHYRHGDPLER